MERMTAADKQVLINAIAAREGTASQLAERYGRTVAYLKAFTEKHKEEIERARELLEAEIPSAEITPMQLDDLWISNKFERLKRLQALAEVQYQDAETGKLIGTELSTALREFRSYLALAANELGQLLHRGSGDSGSGDTLSLDFQNVDLDDLR